MSDWDEDFYDGPIKIAPAAEPHPAPTPAITVRTTARPVAPAAYLLIPEDQWTARNLRDYVTGEITSRFGTPPMANAAAEMAIFKSFCDRWGDKAGPIARQAFEIYRGWWASSPITVTRFCKNSDPFFASKIAERLPGRGR